LVGVLATVALLALVGSAIYFLSGWVSIDVRAIALRQVPAASNPRIVRIVDLPPDGDGVRYALVVIRADSEFHIGCDNVRGTHHGRCDAHYAVVAVALNEGNYVAWPGMAFKHGLTGAQLAAIARARHANRQFRRFTNIPNWQFPCAIPRRDAPGGTVAGSCTTEASPANHVGAVTFEQNWKQNGLYNYDRWIVRFDHKRRVRSITHHGKRNIYIPPAPPV
jgi:hypothetical protein